VPARLVHPPRSRPDRARGPLHGDEVDVQRPDRGPFRRRLLSPRPVTHDAHCTLDNPESSCSGHIRPLKTDGIHRSDQARDTREFDLAPIGSMWTGSCSLLSSAATLFSSAIRRSLHLLSQRWPRAGYDASRPHHNKQSSSPSGGSALPSWGEPVGSRNQPEPKPAVDRRSPAPSQRRRRSRVLPRPVRFGLGWRSVSSVFSYSGRS
jgi:hypothetical protein